MQMGTIQPGDDIIITKWIGLKGTAVIARSHADELAERYPVHMIEDAQHFEDGLSVAAEEETARKCGADVVWNVAEGGIFRALWEMAEESGVGLEIDLRKIPLRQETVEICEFFGLNPYQLLSGGCLLIAARDGNTVVWELFRQGIPAAVVGKATPGIARILRNEDKIRYLDRPKPDEIHRLRVS